MKQFDTYLIGRKTFDAMQRMGSGSRSTPGIQHIVLSRTLNAGRLPPDPGEAGAEKPARRTPATGTIGLEFDIVRVS